MYQTMQHNWISTRVLSKTDRCRKPATVGNLVPIEQNESSLQGQAGKQNHSEPIQTAVQTPHLKSDCEIR